MFTLINKSNMNKQQLINKFSRSLIVEEKRKNKITTTAIASTLIIAALNIAFVNESCKSTGKVSKSQVIYRKVEVHNLDDVRSCFKLATIRFLKCLKILSRNRKFIVSFDTTKEAFYGEQSKAEDKIYLHEGSVAKESDFYYEFLTCSINGNTLAKYILDGIIVPVGYYVEDYVYEMTKFVIDNLPVDVTLFDRGFTSWGVIYKLNKLPVKFIIFWKKEGNWYKEYFDDLKDGEFKRILRESKYNRDKTNYPVLSYFILIKQLEHDNKKYDWIFATNMSLKKAEDYVKRYKKRWGIETIYRVTDDIRIFTTSTKAIIRYFLFMFTCLVYNIWRYFRMLLGEEFTLSNFKVNMTIFLAKTENISPKHFDEFEKIARTKF